MKSYSTWFDSCYVLDFSLLFGGLLISSNWNLGPLVLTSYAVTFSVCFNMKNGLHNRLVSGLESRQPQGKEGLFICRNFLITALDWMFSV